MKTKVLAGFALAAVSMVAAPNAAFSQVAPTVAAGSASHWLPWTFMGCTAGIVTSAVVANYRDNRPLTKEEAWTCGVLYWFAAPQTGTIKVARKSKKKI